MAKLLTIKELPAVPPKGQSPGFFSGIKIETGKDDLGKDYKRLRNAVTLEAKGPDGKPFKVEKVYNLLGRGVRDFQADFLSWSGRLLPDEELAAFDAEGAMNGKPVVVDLSHRKTGKNKLEAEIEKFLPAAVPVEAAANQL